MRIVAGEFRGRAIAAPDGQDTRPTTDRVREALMSSIYSLNGGFEGISVLDAFAGSGALGLEALSRGAAHADFFECDKGAARVIESNIKACGLSRDRVRLYRADVLRYFSVDGQVGTSEGSPYGLVFLDPPYAFGVDAALSFARVLGTSGALADDAIIAVEYAQKDAARLEQAAGEFAIIKMRKYGKTGVALLMRDEGRGE